MWLVKGLRNVQYDERHSLECRHLQAKLTLALKISKGEFALGPPNIFLHHVRTDYSRDQAVSGEEARHFEKY